MENVSIILENGISQVVSGLFYIYNSKYYFMYTNGELVDSDYVQLYVVQVCKEVQKTINGSIDTGYMIGIETSDAEEWSKLQQSITKIVEDKKNGTISEDIKYLPISMLLNLKIISKNKFKLMKHIVEENFKISSKIDGTVEIQPIEPVVLDQQIQSNDITSVNSDVIIDYRTKFFEEQEKNKELQEQIKNLQSKLDSIKSIL